MGFIRCKHYNGRDLFNGSAGGKCLAGVDPIYSFAGGNRTGWVRKVPCLRTNETDAICPAAEYPTREEADREEQAFKALVGRILAIRADIEAQHKATGQWSGSIDCQKCGEQIRWSKAQCSGHVHARCKTKGCISWME